MTVKRHKRALVSIYQRCCLFIAFVIAAFYPCEAQHTNPNAFAPCQPVIKAAHYSISCFDQKNSNNVQIPTVDMPCGGAIIGLSHEDTYHELGSSRAPGLTGYFDHSNWEKISGDGGVDVTGAPNCILVEGANIAQVSVAPLRNAILRIVIPTEGYVAFDWKNIGGSNLLFDILVNAQVYPVKTKNFYKSPFLKAGDTLGIRFQSTETLKVQLSNFDFYTDAIAVTERHWTATDAQKNQITFSQFIAIKRPALANIIFPEDWDAKQKIALNATGIATAPESTGFPMLDEDGDNSTLQDQRYLGKDDCGLKVRWNDELSMDAAGQLLRRNWQIQDIYNGNIIEHVQQIRVQGITSRVTPGSDLNSSSATARSNNVIKNANNKSVSFLDTSHSSNYEQPLAAR